MTKFKTAAAALSLLFAAGPAFAWQPPCSGAYPEVTKQVNTTSSTTAVVLAHTGNTTMFVCKLNVSQTTGGTFQLEYGSGTNCGTGTTVLTGAYPALAGIISMGSESGEVMRIPAGNDLCSVGGSGGVAKGFITAAQFQTGAP